MENSMVIGMRALDLNGRITYVNPAFCRMIGWTEQELVGRMPPFPYWPPNEIGEMQKHIELTLRGKAPANGMELRMMRRDGTSFYARMYVSPLIDARGRHTGWMSSITDITEPKRAREDLAAAHDRFTTVLESLDAAVSVLSTDKAELLFANRYYRQLFGWEAFGHLQLSGQDVDTDDVSSDALDLVDAYAGLPASELTPHAADAREIYVPSMQKWFEVRRRYIQWVDGHLAQMQIATDITVRKAAEEMTRQHEERLQFTSRLTTMGEMASSLAHELNQPLASGAGRHQQLLHGRGRPPEERAQHAGRADPGAGEDLRPGGARRHHHPAHPRFREAQPAAAARIRPARDGRGRRRPGRAGSHSARHHHPHTPAGRPAAPVC
jgi:PAS domain S-box-containing protein